MAEKKGYNRRDFLKIVGASTGVAAAGCGSELPEKLVPYVVQPDEVIPGVATWYSGACGECQSGCGILVRTREGRVVKVEGNPHHPVNRGGLCAIGQSSVQGLYDPDRVREPLKRDVNGSFKPVSWKDALDAVAEAVAVTSKAGKQTVFVTNPLNGSEQALFDDFSQAVPGTKQQSYELFSRSLLDRAAAESFGANSRLHFDFSQARVIVSLGADFLETWLSPVEFTKDFANNRVPDDHGAISKFFHVEPRLSVTGANADHWVKNRPGTECLILEALYREVTGKTPAGSVGSAEELLKESGVAAAVVHEMAEALKSAKGRSLVLAGGVSGSGPQARRLALLANALNSELGNIGKTVLVYRRSGKQAPSDYAALLELSKQLSAENSPVGVVVFSGVNPVYNTPDKSGVREGLAKAGLVVCHATHLDETAKLAQIVLPKSTSFESWGDAEPLPGVFNLNQPAMQPLYKTESLGDLLIALLASAKIGKAVPDIGSYYDYIRAQWKKRTGESNFDSRWLTYVERGGDWSQRGASDAGARSAAVKLPEVQIPKAEGLTLLAFPTVHFGDGSPANRPWTHEVPDPMTSSVWGAWIEINPETAKKHHVKNGKVAQLRTPHGALEAPIYVTPRIAADVVAVPIGLGRSGLGRYSNGVGVSALAVLPPAAAEGAQQFMTGGVTLETSVARETLVLTMGSDTQLGRGIIRTVSTKKLSEMHGSDHALPHGVVDGDKHDAHGDGHAAKGHGDDGHKKGGLPHHDLLSLGPRHEVPQMYKQLEHPVYRWAMSVDLARCTGCSACVTACYAENNIAVVGKEMVDQGREMAWLRIERYFDGPEHAPNTGFLPMMCQHCANAPCEPVCPVYATYHSDEGLNTMVYNRCVGTRYCSNNCSYKVRRFNWWNFNYPSPLNWQLNPDVTQRSIGVMEKCTFCIQRIREVENVSKNEGRLVRDGEIQPACASSCPSDAITFGNLKDKKSKVYKHSQDKRVYRILQAEINTQPAVHYLARVVHEGDDAGHAEKA